MYDKFPHEDFVRLQYALFKYAFALGITCHSDCEHRSFKSDSTHNIMRWLGSSIP